jgi:hypothetical protein
MDAAQKLIAALTKSGKATVNEDGKLKCTICGHSLSKAIEEAVMLGEGDSAEELIAELGHRCAYTHGLDRIPVLQSAPEGFVTMDLFYDAVLGQIKEKRDETPRRVLHRIMGKDRYYPEDRHPLLKEVPICKVGKRLYAPLGAVSLAQEALANPVAKKAVLVDAASPAPVALKKKRK